MSSTQVQRPTEPVFEQKRALSLLSMHEIHARIEDFRKQDTRLWIQEHLVRAIARIMSVEAEGKFTNYLVRRLSTIPSGAHLFRARREHGKSDTRLSVPLPFAAVEADAWAPPPQYVTKAGRLNAPNEPVLYASLEDPRVAVAEVRAACGEVTAIFGYRAKRDIITSQLGIPIHDPRFTVEELAKLNLFEQFLYEEFTREVESGSEILYRPPQTIAKLWYNLPFQDAWIYPSIRGRTKMNLAFDPNKAKECLELRGALIGSLNNKNRLVFASVAVLDQGRFTYHGLGSTAHLETFPEIVTNIP